MRRPVVIAFVFVTAGAVLLLVRPWEGETMPTSTPEGPPPITETPNPPPTTPTPIVRYDAPVEKFLLPDGSYARSLNGIQNAPDLRWPSDIPFSPIVDRVTEPNGDQWYVHDNGARSTTVMVYRSDLGKQVPVTRLAMPTDPVPVLPRGKD